MCPVRVANKRSTHVDSRGVRDQPAGELQRGIKNSVLVAANCEPETPPIINGTDKKSAWRLISNGKSTIRIADRT